ncbi:hypothetical protein Veis_2937 [Verminephrobacter eiseniae EF01-2]|uniref:Uncharacterized protein n=1 Tax=Verminephrobacter eiseniae (strain EF01-2) TaxID=391735 RepID=A1WM16_VEREI|nr:hypothetical protein Veis_2937 [Verminephrobacter eiseniae EF01-2]
MIVHRPAEITSRIGQSAWCDRPVDGAPRSVHPCAAALAQPPDDRAAAGRPRLLFRPGGHGCRRACRRGAIGVRPRPKSSACSRSCRVTDQMSQAARSHRSAAQGASRSPYRAYWQAMQRRDALRWPAQTDR